MKVEKLMQQNDCALVMCLIGLVRESAWAEEALGLVKSLYDYGGKVSINDQDNQMIILFERRDFSLLL